MRFVLFYHFHNVPLHTVGRRLGAAARQDITPCERGSTATPSGGFRVKREFVKESLRQNLRFCHLPEGELPQSGKRGRPGPLTREVFLAPLYRGTMWASSPTRLPLVSVGQGLVPPRRRCIETERHLRPSPQGNGRAPRDSCPPLSGRVRPISHIFLFNHHNELYNNRKLKTFEMNNMDWRIRVRYNKSRIPFFCFRILPRCIRDRSNKQKNIHNFFLLNNYFQHKHVRYNNDPTRYYHYRNQSNRICVDYKNLMNMISRMCNRF